MDIIAYNICKLRKEFKYTSQQVAEYLDVSVDEIIQYESGIKTIPSEYISKLAILFNVDEIELFEENPSKNNILSLITLPAKNMQAKDLKAISAFKKTVLNYIHLSEVLK